jgi:hypothetical protein
MSLSKIGRGLSNSHAPVERSTSEPARQLPDSPDQPPRARARSSKSMIPRSVKEFGKAVMAAPAAILKSMDQANEREFQQMIDVRNGALPGPDEAIKQSAVRLKAGLTKGLANLMNRHGGAQAARMNKMAEQAAQQSLESKRNMAREFYKYADERLAHAQEKLNKAELKTQTAAGTPKQQKAEAALARAQEKLAFAEADRAAAYANRAARDA